MRGVTGEKPNRSGIAADGIAADGIAADGIAADGAELEAKRSHRPLARRRWLGLMAATAVVAFDPLSRRWVAVAEAREAGAESDAAAETNAGAWHYLPRLDGELVFDEAALDAAADDFGHIIHERPRAVLRPGSVRDVQRIIRFANRRQLSVSMRGQGHSTQGQSQAEAGIVIDSRSLAAIESISEQGAVVGPGARWLDVLVACLEQGLTPPVFTDFIELSVGGTLSGGGIGGATQRHGLQVNNVLELELVTGEGELIRCSPQRRPAIFNAVLGGLGQLGIIVRATLKLVIAPESARVYRLFYSELSTFLRDQRLAASSQRFHYLEGQVLPQADGSLQFMLEAAAYYTLPEVPDDAALLAGFEPLAGATLSEEHSYFDWVNRLAPLFDALRASGAFGLPHPWFDVFLPDAAADAYLADVLAKLVPEDINGGPILCYAFPRDAVRGSFVALPDSDIVFLFDLLRFAPPVPAVVDALVAQNRTLFERARDLGGKRYPIGSIPFSVADWAEHFGPAFPELAALKSELDPHVTLTPGQKMFPRADG
jgi:cytokinin dehydrogenase